ncbi:MAG: flagellar M-ring protein FliF [Magnetococcales bacterium]|nr:flagellar M-ring protein FliF [Magnetococcales bacterium]
MAEATSAMAARSEAPAESFTRFLERLPLGGRNGLMLAVAATVLALTAIIWFATRPSYKVLYSGLPEQEAGKVVAQLTQMNVPYQLAMGGTTIEVPANRLYNVRLDMASQGLPKQGTGTGFEIFDKTNLVGMTDFLQRMNFQRGLQGELARTIESIDAVSKARVHLVLPKKSLFVSEDKRATASVVMELSRPLSAKQTEGITHLVASAVEGLEESDVTLLDHKGNLISGKRATSVDGRMPAEESLSLQRQVEKSLEDRAQAMLDKVVGVNTSGVSRSIVRITAELDLKRVERSEEKFDPEGQVARSEQTVNENSKGSFGESGVPGVRPNDANDRVKSTAAGSEQSRSVERETVNYEISKSVSKITLPVGTIQRLSIAVLVDGHYEADPKNKNKDIYKERTGDELAQLQKLIEQAVGFRTQRGDTIQVTSAPFEPLSAVAEQTVKFWERPEFYLQAGLVLVILLLLFLVLKPMVSRLLLGEKSPDSSGVPSAVAELEAQLMAEGVGTLPTEQPMRMRLPDRNIKLTQQMITEHADEAREILRSWLLQED